MKTEVAIFTKPFGKFQFKTLDCKPSHDELLIKILCCNICGADINTYKGKRQVEAPTILGHEYIGEIVSVPNGITKDYWGNELNLGDKITWYMISFCNSCKYCVTGIPQKCLNMKKFGHQKLDNVVNGGLSNFVSLNRKNIFYKTPNNLPYFISASLTCAGATAVSAANIITNIENKSILIVGAGLLGIYLAIVLKHYNASKISVIANSDTSVKRLNLLYFKNVHLTNSSEDIKKLSDKYDVIIDAVGSSEYISALISNLDIGGTFILLGSTHPVPDVKVNPTDITKKMLRVIGLHNYTPADLADAINIFSANFSLLEPLFPFFIKYPLKDLNNAIDTNFRDKPLRICLCD